MTENAFLSVRYKLSSSHVPEELAESSWDLTNRAVALVELAADTWIVTGRRPIPVMMAAVYLAWQSLKPTKLRLRYSLDKFCQIAKVNKHKIATKRVMEMKEVLCKLGKEVPWHREPVTPDNVLQQVEDILKYRYALLRRALRTHEEALPAECQTSGDDSATEESVSAHVSESAEENQNESSQEHCEINSDRPLAPGDGSDGERSAPELHGDAEERPDQPPNWGKRALFAPPCVTNPKKRRAEPPEMKEVTGDEEISDSEIDSYIRTPREARDFALMQKILEGKNNAV